MLEKEVESIPTVAAKPERLSTPAELDLRVRIKMQYELFAERYGHEVQDDADLKKWQQDGHAQRFTELVKGDPKAGIAPDPEIVELIESGNIEAAKVKIRKKLFAKSPNP